jgi:hypothetical protein
MTRLTRHATVLGTALACGLAGCSGAVDSPAKHDVDAGPAVTGSSNAGPPPPSPLDVAPDAPDAADECAADRPLRIITTLERGRAGSLASSGGRLFIQSIGPSDEGEGDVFDLDLATGARLDIGDSAGPKSIVVSDAHLTWLSEKTRTATAIDRVTSAKTELRNVVVADATSDRTVLAAQNPSGSGAALLALGSSGQEKLADLDEVPTLVAAGGSVVILSAGTSNSVRVLGPSREPTARELPGVPTFAVSDGTSFWFGISDGTIGRTNLEGGDYKALTGNKAPSYRASAFAGRLAYVTTERSSAVRPVSKLVIVEPSGDARSVVACRGPIGGLVITGDTVYFSAGASVLGRAL